MPDPRTPTPGQLQWLEAELGLFCHFGINTFFGKEWSDGTLPAGAFAPTDLDARQWVEVAKAGGFRYLILTAKHHDGFCLWPTETTDYSVASSPWRGGKGDVVAEVAEACREGGIRLGLYLSPWDRHEPCYADPAAYDRFYCRQLEELCTRYGDLFELWFDGAGSENRVYNWDAIMAVAERHQPGAMVFNMGRPTIRWVGNEDGLASDPNYLCVDSLGISAFAGGAADRLAEMRCLPAECDVAIRRHWFWQPDDLHTLKSVEHLLAIYYRSVGLGSNLLLNMGIDRRGRIADEDRDRWLETWAELRLRFKDAHAASIQVAGDDTLLRFSEEVELDHFILREDLSQGQRIDGFELLDGEGRRVFAGRTIGRRRIVPFERSTARPAAPWVLRRHGGPARLMSADGYRTGHESMPALGPSLDYDAWAALAASKVDR